MEDKTMRLPGEDQLRDAILKEHGPELEVTSDLLNIGVGVFLNPVRPVAFEVGASEAVDSFELLICLGLVAKACRQFRGVVAVAEISLSDVAESNGRMLLETMLTVEFLTRPTVTLKRNGKVLPDVSGHSLTRLLRSRLYLVHDAAGTLKTLRGMVSTGDLRSPNADHVLRVAESHVQEYSDEIGPEWTERLKHGTTCAGVSALDLADSLGLLPIYHAFYRPASARIHASDASRYVEVTEKAGGGLIFSATSSMKGVAEALMVSSLAMLDILTAVNQRLELRLEGQLHAIGPRIQEMTGRLPVE